MLDMVYKSTYIPEFLCFPCVKQGRERRRIKRLTNWKHDSLEFQLASRFFCRLNYAFFRNSASPSSIYIRVSASSVPYENACCKSNTRCIAMLPHALCFFPILSTATQIAMVISISGRVLPTTMSTRISNL